MQSSDESIGASAESSLSRQKSVCFWLRWQQAENVFSAVLCMCVYNRNSMSKTESCFAATGGVEPTGFANGSKSIRKKHGMKPTGFATGSDKKKYIEKRGFYNE